MSKIPFAVQMYSVRKDFAANPLATMHAIKEMGYTGVEFAGAPVWCPEFYAALLKETGLVCCGWHTPLNLVEGDALARTIAVNQAVGSQNIVVPWLKMASRAEWLAKAAELSALAETLAPYGMRTGFHCHAHEFAALDGERPWDTIFGNCDPSVIMQLDLGNALSGGCDVMETLNRYPGRCRTIHLKPFSKDPAKGFRPVIGDDDVPWKDVFDFCQTKGNTDWYVIEYECEEIPALDAVRQCLDNALKIRG